MATLLLILSRRNPHYLLISINFQGTLRILILTQIVHLSVARVGGLLVALLDGLDELLGLSQICLGILRENLEKFALSIVVMIVLDAVFNHEVVDQALVDMEAHILNAF